MTGPLTPCGGADLHIFRVIIVLLCLTFFMLPGQNASCYIKVKQRTCTVFETPNHNARNICLSTHPSESAGDACASMLASSWALKSNKFLVVARGTESLSLSGDRRRTLSAQSTELLKEAPRWCGIRACRIRVPLAHTGLWCLKHSLLSHPQAALSHPWSQRELAKWSRQ